METHFVKSTEASFIQQKGVVVKFFLGVFFGLSSTVFSFIYQDNLPKSHGIVESKEKREFCMYFLDSATDCIIACFMR